MEKHVTSRSDSRSSSQSKDGYTGDLRKRKSSSSSSYKEKKRHRYSSSPDKDIHEVIPKDKNGKLKVLAKKRKSSSSTDASESSNESVQRKHRSHKIHKKHHKRKVRKHSKKYSSEDSESDSSLSSHLSKSNSSGPIKKKHKERNRKKEKKHHKAKKKRSRKKEKSEKEDTPIGPQLVAGEVTTCSKLKSDVQEDTVLTQRAKAMAPMTKEEWEKRQSVVRRVYDEETGRHRLIKGDGEILEEIVSRDRHREINRQATRGDGDFFQATLASKLQK